MVDQRLVQYLLAEEAQGYTAAQLRSFLISKGYQPEPVDEAIRYAAQNNLHPNLGTEHERTQNQTTPVACPKGAIVVSTALFLLGAWFVLASISLYIAALQLMAFLPGPEELATWGDVPGVGILSALSMPLFTGLFAALLIIGIAHIIFAIGLFSFKKWGYWGAVALSGLACLSIIGVIPGMLFLLVLLNKKTKAAID